MPLKTRQRENGDLILLESIYFWKIKEGNELENIVFSEASIDLWGVDVKLPKGFVGCNDSLSLDGYEYKLPNCFKYCRGELSILNYEFELPDNFQFNEVKNIICNKKSKVNINEISQKFPNIKIKFYC